MGDETTVQSLDPVWSGGDDRMPNLTRLDATTIDIGDGRYAYVACDPASGEIVEVGEIGGRDA
jgi:hypothetical protein